MLALPVIRSSAPASCGGGDESSSIPVGPPNPAEIERHACHKNNDSGLLKPSREKEICGSACPV